MEKRVDIIPFLEGIVAENTQHYQLDLMFDEQRFEKAMLEPRQEDRTFLWMSRPSGTWCFLEREVFLRETPAHTTWTYRDYVADAAHIKAFRIILAPGRPGALVLGRIQPLNYGEQVQRVKQNALHVQTVEMTAGNGETYAAPYADYPGQYRRLLSAYGEFQKIHYKPESETELSNVLQAERELSAARRRSHRPRKPPSR